MNQPKNTPESAMRAEIHQWLEQAGDRYQATQRVCRALFDTVDSVNDANAVRDCWNRVRSIKRREARGITLHPRTRSHGVNQ